MNKNFRAALFKSSLLKSALIGVGLICSVSISAAPPFESHAKGRILVQPRAGLSDAELDKLLKQHGAKSVKKISQINVHIVELPANASEKAVAALLAHNPHIKFAELDMRIRSTAEPNDPRISEQWHLAKIDAPTAWDLSTGANITIAILDSGVDPAHPDLVSQLVAGWNAFDNNSNTTDVYGHGTLVAGSAAAAINNGLGIASVAGSAKIMPIRITDTGGYGYYSTLINGITWAADHGARVANVSFSPIIGSSAVTTAAQYMQSKGGVVVSSAGNTGAFDASVDNAAIICVSATDGSDNLAGWSSFGNYVDVAAPGAGILTTANGGAYSAASGTSFSSPVTAGVIALMMSANPNLSSAEYESILKSTAVDLGSAGYDQYFGRGRVNAAAAVQAVMNTSSRDTQAPSVSITNPTGGTAKGIVAVDINANDNVGVIKVDLAVNGTKIATDITAPYAFSVDTTQFPDGTAKLTAFAYDEVGNYSTSNAVNINIANTPDLIAPSVQITNPANGANIGNSTTVNIRASDNVGVSKLSLFIDGEMKTSTAGTSLSFKWNTRKVSNGAHTISAVAEDAAGNKSTTTIQVFK